MLVDEFRIKVCWRLLFKLFFRFAVYEVRVIEHVGETTVSLEHSNSGTCKIGADEAADATCEVHDARPCEVYKADVGKPSIFPAPRQSHWED